MIVNRSIEYSGLLITRTLRHDKHQLRDFFNRHRRFHSKPLSGRLRGPGVERPPHLPSLGSRFEHSRKPRRSDGERRTGGVTRAKLSAANVVKSSEDTEAYQMNFNPN
jgi:hypothetical protein